MELHERSSKLPIPGRPRHSGLLRLGVAVLLLSIVASLLAGCAPARPGPVPTSDGQFAVLLMGYGGPGHGGPFLTDSMMVAIVDPGKGTVTMLSLPRDSWVPLDFADGAPSTYAKLNTAYAYAKDTADYPSRLARYDGPNGAGNMAKDTVSRILGIPIDYYLAVDFQTFRDLIDSVGGIDVNIPDSFTARYPASDDPAVNANWTTVHFDKGPQHLDGNRALQFARAREVLDNPSEGTDFARATRQRLILTALKARVLQPSGLIHLPELLSIARSQSDTDLSPLAALGLLRLIASWNGVKITQAALSNENYLQDATGPGGAYILVPNAHGYSWSQVRAFARRLWSNPMLGVQMSQAEVLVVNRTGQDGLAGDVADRLVALGYDAITPATGSVQATTDVVDKTGGKASAIVAGLSSDLGLPTPRVTPGKMGDYPLVILDLGQDALGVVDASQPPTDSQAPTSEVDVAHVGWSP